MKKRLNKALALLIAVMLVIGIMPTAFADGEETTLEKSGVKIVYDLGLFDANVSTASFATTKGFWDYEGSSLSNLTVKDHYAGIQVQLSANNWWAVKVYLPKAGCYDLGISLITHTQGGQADVYFGQAKDAASLIEEEYKVNKEKSVSFYASTTTTSYAPVNVGGVNVEEPGEYTVVLKATAKGDGTADTNTSSFFARQFLQQIILDGCGEGSETAATIGSIKLGESDSISAGSTAELTTTAYNGITAEALDASAVTYGSSDDTILSIDGATATAHKPGTVTITANSEGWGNPVEKTVTVAPAVPYSDITVVYDSVVNGYDKVAEQTFTTTNGFWEYGEASTEMTFAKNNICGMAVHLAEKAWWSMKVFVPKAGSYKVIIPRSTHASGGKSKVYFAEKGTEYSDILKSDPCGSVDFTSSENATSTVEEVLVGYATVEKPGEHIILFYSDEKGTSGARQYFSKIILDGGNNTVPMLNITAEPDTITVGETATVTATSTLMSDGVTEVTPTISYNKSDIVYMDGTTVTALSDGVATVTATATVGDVSSSRSVNITVNNKEISDGFNAEENTETYAPSVTAYTCKDGESAVLENTETDTYITDNGDGTYTLVAPDDEGTYKFLYWVKGLETKKRVVSTSRSFTYRATKDNSHLIAVYENTADETEAKAEFYNANMQLIESNNTGKVPALPVLAGYGEAIAWVSEDSTEYTTAGAAATLKANGTTMFIAKYKDEEEIAPLSITATDATVSNPAPAYGNKVTVTANTDSEGNVFQYFTKNGEVVCLDREYSFNAYESCNVVAVYGTKAPTYVGNTRKIFLDAFDVTTSEKGLMAEFIGFENDNVVEKGIMLGTRKMSMTTTKTQFTIIADEEGTYTGYAIIKDGESFLIITDGEYTKK